MMGRLLSSLGFYKANLMKLVSMAGCPLITLKEYEFLEFLPHGP